MPHPFAYFVSMKSDDAPLSSSSVDFFPSTVARSFSVLAGTVRTPLRCSGSFVFVFVIDAVVEVVVVFVFIFFFFCFSLFFVGVGGAGSDEVVSAMSDGDGAMVAVVAMGSDAVAAASDSCDAMCTCAVFGCPFDTWRCAADVDHAGPIILIG